MWQHRQWTPGKLLREWCSMLLVRAVVGSAAGACSVPATSPPLAPLFSLSPSLTHSLTHFSPSFLFVCFETGGTRRKQTRAASHWAAQRQSQGGGLPLTVHTRKGAAQKQTKTNKNKPNCVCPLDFTRSLLCLISCVIGCMAHVLQCLTVWRAAQRMLLRPANTPAAFHKACWGPFLQPLVKRGPQRVLRSRTGREIERG